LIDFFEENKMGYLLESTEPDEYAEKVIKLFEDEEKLKKIGKYDHKYAIDNFLASKVASNLENIFKEILN
ncbi:MAG TPA: hypothetical protein VK084_08455, partial [Chitinophagaceae bacterium]|nr:hypothetical protein [Chitinophagaceae bacterium]